MYLRPTNSLTDRLAHLLSEIMNDSTPIGWEIYRGHAACLLTSQPLRDILREHDQEKSDG